MRINHAKETVTLSSKERTAIQNALAELSAWYNDSQESRAIWSMIDELEKYGLYRWECEEDYNLNMATKRQTFTLACKVGENEYGDGIYYHVENALFILSRYWGFMGNNRVEIMGYLS